MIFLWTPPSFIAPAALIRMATALLRCLRCVRKRAALVTARKISAAHLVSVLGNTFRLARTLACVGDIAHASRAFAYAITASSASLRVHACLPQAHAHQ